MSSGNRPLSPHLQIYRPQLTAVLSILHRLTGVALAPGTLLLVYWLVAAAAGPEAFATAQMLVGSIVVAALQWQSALGMTRADCLQTFTPLAHILGIANLGAGIASGARHRLFARFDPTEVLQSIEDDGVTIGITVAPVALALTGHPALEDNVRLSMF